MDKTGLINYIIVPILAAFFILIIVITMIFNLTTKHITRHEQIICISIYAIQIVSLICVAIVWCIRNRIDMREFETNKLWILFATFLFTTCIYIRFVLSVSLIGKLKDLRWTTSNLAIRIVFSISNIIDMCFYIFMLSIVSIMTFHLVFLLLVSLGKNDNPSTMNQLASYAVENNPIIYHAPPGA